MRLLRYGICCVAAALIGIGVAWGVNDPGKEKPGDLPRPVLAGSVTLEEAIANRRSVRQFSNEPLTRRQIGQLCWAGQGVTDAGGRFRASPSAGALYPIELYVVTADGVDHYLPKGHRRERHLAGDLRRALQEAALGQDPVGQAAACVVIAAVVERTSKKYGDRAERYCFIEAGHVAQNILLQATALQLGGVPIGAYHDEKVAQVLKLPKDHRVLYLLPVGHPRG
ncbi:MAG: SagB/ThcOx family dehydrogenase [Phycisphaerae bacterium]|nr:SagB/ThcOx family dehydrogenase [Phycisphaerae bacterium]